MDKSPLDLLGKQCHELLAAHLPQLSPDWWQALVVDQLTYQQAQYLREGGITSLDKLDIAALLRLVDKNWYELAQALAWPIAARNWLKEAQTIRNRWAHAPTAGLNDEDTYRDLDTLERLMALLGANQEILEKLRTQKSSLIVSLSGQPSFKSNSTINPPAPGSGFGKGALVRLKARPAVTGAIIDHLPGDPEDRYMVFHDGAVATYYTSQLEPTAALSARMEVAPDALHAALTALQLRHTEPLQPASSPG